jgi:hypothetical protein
VKRLEDFGSRFYSAIAERTSQRRSGICLKGGYLERVSPPNEERENKEYP